MTALISTIIAYFIIGLIVGAIYSANHDFLDFDIKIFCALIFFYPIIGIIFAIEGLVGIIRDIF